MVDDNSRVTYRPVESITLGTPKLVSYSPATTQTVAVAAVGTNYFYGGP